jgi:hypothetical protein
MQRDSFTKALVATAKIACCASLLNVGCRNKTPIETPEPAPNSNDTTNIVEEAPTSSETNATEPFETCAPILTEGFADGAFPDATTVSQEVKDCCALTAEYYDNLAMANGVFDYGVIDSWTERSQCCAVNNWNDGSMACTPWGPPTPPSANKMKRRIIVPARAILS